MLFANSWSCFNKILINNISAIQSKQRKKDAHFLLRLFLVEKLTFFFHLVLSYIKSKK